MNVIPFRRPAPQQEPVAFTIGARVDLRVGAVASGVIRPRGETDEVFSFSNLARTLRAARMAWKERGIYAVLSLAVPAEMYARLEADLLHEAAQEAGCTRHLMGFELCEREIVTHGAELAEALRERGWGVVLRGDDKCPLPFGARARSLYTELVLEAPEAASPFLALEDGDRSPLGRRLIAAKAAGLTITAENVRTAAQAKTLAIAGFDRGGGPFAEASLR
ncbi:hypothetical protein [Terricaulis sp.]|uniref:hypothetical protein n=1 Tax=Terricaulis sp. TaxID=2768686 RepID=UPI003783F01B